MAKEHGGLCTAANLALESSPSLLPSAVLFQTLPQTIQGREASLENAGRCAGYTASELGESKPLVKSKCHQVNKESGSDTKGLCLSLLKVMPFPKAQMNVVCW